MRLPLVLVLILAVVLGFLLKRDADKSEREAREVGRAQSPKPGERGKRRPEPRRASKATSFGFWDMLVSRLLGCGARREQAPVGLQMLRAAGALAGAMVWGCGGGTRVSEEGRRPSGALQAGVWGTNVSYQQSISLHLQQRLFNYIG